MSKEYRNVVEHQTRSFCPKYYECELWIDGKFIQPCTFDEVTYRYNVLMEKLKSYMNFGVKLNQKTIDEIDEVMQLKYEEGAADGHEDL